MQYTTSASFFFTESKPRIYDRFEFEFEFEFIYLSTLHCEMGRKGKSCVVQLEGPLRPYTRQQWAGTEEHFQ